MILKLRIDSQDLRRFVPETYPAAEPDALVNIVPVGVVVPLVAVQTGSGANHRRCTPAPERRGRRRSE